MNKWRWVVWLVIVLVSGCTGMESAASDPVTNMANEFNSDTGSAINKYAQTWARHTGPGARPDPYYVVMAGYLLEHKAPNR